MIAKVRITKTPYGRHLHTARIKGEPTYGWGNTPAEARAKLYALLLQNGRIEAAK